MNSNKQPYFSTQVVTNNNSTKYKCFTPKKSKIEDKSKSKQKFTITKQLNKKSRTFLKKNSTENKLDDSNSLTRANKFIEGTYTSNNNSKINPYFSPYNCNILAQSPFSFEKYVNSYSRDNMNVLSLLNNKRQYKKELKLKNYINNFNQQINRGQNNCFCLTSVKHFNNYQLINSELIFKQSDDEINNNFKNNNFINIYQINNNFNFSKNVDLDRTITCSDNTSKFNESPNSFFADDIFINDLSKNIEQEFSLPLSENQEYGTKEENELEIYRNLFKNEEFPAKNLNFEEEDYPLVDLIKTNNLINQPQIAIIDLEKTGKKTKKIKQQKSRKNIKIKINETFKIDDFYKENCNLEKITGIKEHNEIKSRNTPSSSDKNSNRKKRKIFKCMENCISTGSDSQNKSKDSTINIKKRIRKTDSQILIMENLINSNSDTKELMAEISIKTGLSTKIIYKWIWDQKKKNTLFENKQNQTDFENVKDVDNNNNNINDIENNKNLV